MCSSAVVVASDSSSLPEVLGDGGIYFNPYSTAEMASALSKALLMSDEEAQQYRRYCRERAEELTTRWGQGPPLPGL